MKGKYTQEKNYHAGTACVIWPLLRERVSKIEREEEDMHKSLNGKENMCKEALMNGMYTQKTCDEGEYMQWKL